VRYGAHTALDRFTCRIEPGSTGLLGPNGAGKTTLLKALLGFVPPTSGTGNVLGYSLDSGAREIRQRVGFMPEQDCHIPGLTAVGFVAYAGEHFDDDGIDVLHVDRHPFAFHSVRLHGHELAAFDDRLAP
jgi:ABC-2 type transport system ATP-binding protein